MLLFLALLVLFGVAAYFVVRGRPTPIARRIVQSAAFVVLGVLFMQCLCISKQAVLATRSLAELDFATCLKWGWFPLTVIALVVLFGRAVYCHWICPVGFLSDMTGKVGGQTRTGPSGEGPRRGVLWCAIVFCVAAVAGAWVYCPQEPVKAIGGWVGVALLVLLIPLIIHPRLDAAFRFLKYVVLAGWILFPLLGHKVLGPWCVPAGFVMSYAAVVSFVCVLLASMLVPRAWCRFLCPDGALFELIGKRRKRREGEDESDAAHEP